MYIQRKQAHEDLAKVAEDDQDNSLLENSAKQNVFHSNAEQHEKDDLKSDDLSNIIPQQRRISGKRVFDVSYEALPSVIASCQEQEGLNHLC